MVVVLFMQFSRCDTGDDSSIQLFEAGAVFLGSGDKRTRTADILLAKQALYQLSYTPTLVGVRWAILDLNQRPHPYQGCALTN